MDETAKLSPAVTQEIATFLGLLDVPQTRRMACAVVANAMVFHDRIAVIHPEIRALNGLWESDTDNPQEGISEEWTAVLTINYWPIFAVAMDAEKLTRGKTRFSYRCQVIFSISWEGFWMAS